jgi:adenine-specific DNA methylase
MTKTPKYPKRLIEVDLPIKKISEHARREKSIRHGHISTLHIWWARRPLAACRAVLCASLWPDPADPLCPESFIEIAKTEMNIFWNTLDTGNREVQDLESLRTCLLDFIADFANWDNSTNEKYLKISRHLTESAHLALGGIPGSRPLVVDPFAGGGSIPLEALRVGADAYASDLNPVAVLLNKVVLEYIPKYGEKLADEVKKWGQWINEEAEKELAQYYPKDSDGSIPIAYLWARTITCEGSGCGTEVPLIRSLWLSKGKNQTFGLKFNTNCRSNKIEIEILSNPNLRDIKDGTITRGTVTCPLCGYTTPSNSVKLQFKKNMGGADNSRLFCVVTKRNGKNGRKYRTPTDKDLLNFELASEKIKSICLDQNHLNLIPSEKYPDESGSGALSSSVLYGFDKWGNLFNARQKLLLISINLLIKKVVVEFEGNNKDFNSALKTLLAIALDRQAEHSTSLCRWNSSGEKMQATFGRQALPMAYDYCECNPFGGSVGSWKTMIDLVTIPFETASCNDHIGTYNQGDARSILLPDDISSLFFTDPPYYDAIAYADLSDFFYVWLKRLLKPDFPELFNSELVDKKNEIVQLSKRFPGPYSNKTQEYFENEMKIAMQDGRRVLSPNGLGVIVFAHKSTSGWEAQLLSLINAGWIITASWPIDTEMGTRMNAMGTAALASSIHLVCRPRENPDGSLRIEVGDYRSVLSELPGRIHEWMQRLVSEDVVGADAIFACLGPALEIFSRYSSVEKPSGEIVALREYLEQVWAAISKEALTTIFSGADTTAFEPDARLTAMWLWTLTAGSGPVTEGEKPVKSTGYELDFDTARKIAQGLGANLEELSGLVEIKGSSARLLPVMERADILFGKGGVKTAKGKKKEQMTLGEVFGEEVSPDPVIDLKEYTSGKTMLDIVHQSMLLHAAGKSELLKIFLMEHGKNSKFWTLAQAFAALYPVGTDERRWVEAVMARKKTLGL